MALTVYFDGLCPLCSREIAHYRRQPGSEAVSFVDIMQPEFDPVVHGIDPVRARQVLHVKVDSEIRTGVDAAIAMWDAIPSYRWLARFTHLPGIHAVANVIYHIFARFRPYLKRGRREKCVGSTCAR